VLHHIVADGWSIDLLESELVSLYNAFSAGLADPLAPLQLQYADFAHWQRQWLTGAVLERQMDYWREQLKGAPPALDLPTDRVRPPRQSLRGASVCSTLPPARVEELRRLGRGRGATLFMVLLAGLDAFLARVTGSEDLLVGTPIANRG